MTDVLGPGRKVTQACRELQYSATPARMTLHPISSRHVESRQAGIMPGPQDRMCPTEATCVHPARAARPGHGDVEGGENY